jgi:pseudouridine-5'-phosphate glycosidase
MSADSVSVAKGGTGTTTVAVTRRGNFRAGVSLSVSGLPAGVKASFSPASSCESKQDYPDCG